MIEQAYRIGESLGLVVATEDEGGPYQAIPHPGTSFHPEGHPAHRPHEYVRGGTVKLLTLFRPFTGWLSAEPVERAPNAILHPWLKQALTALLALCPPVPAVIPPGRRWRDWCWGPDAELLDALYPPIRILLIWDNLAGHRTPAIVRWCAEHGICVLYTPLSGSWLNMAESVQGIIERRALAGQHPEDVATMLTWFRDTVTGWNRAPTPFVWGGKRHARRDRAYVRRHQLPRSGAMTSRPLCRRDRSVRQHHPLSNGDLHGN